MSYEHLKGMEGYTEETIVIGNQVLKYAHYIDPELNSGDKENGTVWLFGSPNLYQTLFP